MSLPKPQHRTIVARELHHIGSDGLPTMHTSDLIIEALEPMQTLPYRFDTDEVRNVEVVLGGTAGEVRAIDDGLHAVDITLDSPLEQGQRAPVAYHTYFRYATEPARESRRGVGKSGMELLIMQVTFDPLKLPRHVYWAQWDGYGADAQIVPGSKEAVELVPLTSEPDGQMEAWYEITNVQPGVYGFYWRW